MESETGMAENQIKAEKMRERIKRPLFFFLTTIGEP